jgi:anti-sigma-K factor RskA
MMGAELDCGRDAAAYVLGALDDNEAIAFRHHMATCATCREEVELLESAANALPMMVPQYQPPSTLRTSVMDEVRRDARRPAAAPAAARTSRSFLARPVPKPVLVALGALAVLAVITVLLSRGPSTSGTQYVRASTAWRGGGAVVALNGSTGQLLVKGMPAPPAGKVYEVWVQHGHGSPSPTDALFDVNKLGEAAVDVPGKLSSNDTVMVTAEPAGGSLVPTPPAVIVASLRTA